MDADDLMMVAVDAGAEDFAEEDDSFEITTSPEDFSAVREAIEKDESIPEDEEKRMQDEIQKLINDYNKKIEDKLAEKEEELMTV